MCFENKTKNMYFQKKQKVHNFTTTSILWKPKINQLKLNKN